MVRARALVAAAASAAAVAVTVCVVSPAPATAQRSVPPRRPEIDFTVPACCPAPTVGPSPKPSKVTRLPRLSFRRARPGDTLCGDVVIDGGAVPKDDLMLLTDVTGSMRSAIATVRKEMTALMNARGAVSTTVRFGVASYRDESEFGFRLNQPLTANRRAVQTAVDSADLNASGGGDALEANLVALHALATDARVGWSSDARRLVAWFGDVPGHEPSCPAPGVRHTRSSVLAALRAARISVIGVSLAGGLDRPFRPATRNSWGSCKPPSRGAAIAAGQGTSLTDGTRGIMAKLVPGTGTEVAALLGLIDALELEITSSLHDCAGVFTTAYTPALPAFVEAGKSLTLRQCVTVDAAACDAAKANALFFRCTLKVLATGALFSVRPVDMVGLKC
ncbi:hypothetical protein BU14_0524s0012 [Porphyra umbilicalis]|uniref:VWFA domain-containing protein n=1 Tax=Porphyra umbilicalis TaxID=2786 RepID=A0A1X6NSC1_PORUM|nr:hypothetical protein BU14_0524s0012 [Porphyra umbilicalis]|eukprot:OSX71529.1 hypothetical protein BU14_0524s0012 [Porphyra umbilicalis]